MKAPKNLRHKPIISVNDYEKFEPTYPNKTDVRALSIGKAQYNQNDISLKVWRETDKNKISRQSEELPIHRNIDLSILFVSSLLKTEKLINSKTRLNEEVVNELELQKIHEYYLTNKIHIDNQLNELKKIIDILL
jgi:hypothetical protein